jgi:hypothetical protein
LNDYFFFSAPQLKRGPLGRCTTIGGVLTSDSRRLGFVVAVVAAISALLQLTERDWLRGVTGLTLAATFAIIATELPERSSAGKWLVYALLVAIFILLGIRLVGT